MPRLHANDGPSGHRGELPVFIALAALPFLAKTIALLLDSQGYSLQSIYKLFQLVAPCWWRYRWRYSRGIRILWPTDEPLPSAGTWVAAIVVAIVLSASGIGAANWLLPHFDLGPEAIRAGLDARFAVQPAGALLVVAFLSLVNSALEELHFRAWLDCELSTEYGSLAGILLSAAAFGAMHVLIFLGMRGLPPVAIALVPSALALAGVAWSLIMRRPGGIHAAWLSHALTDALLLGWGLHWLGYV